MLVGRGEGFGEKKNGCVEGGRDAQAKVGYEPSDAGSQNKMCCKHCDGAFPPQ